MLRRWLRSKYFAGRRVNISSGVPAVLLDSVSPPAFLTADAEVAARQQAENEKNKTVCFTCGLTGHKKAACPSIVGSKVAPGVTAASVTCSVEQTLGQAAAAPSATASAESAISGQECEEMSASEGVTTDDLRNSTYPLTSALFCGFI